MFYIASLFLSSLVGTTSWNCISIKSQECKVRPEIINVNSNEPVFHPLVLKQVRTNETRHIKWHETCKCKCRLDASVCNNKQRWNNDKCQCECK